MDKMVIPDEIRLLSREDGVMESIVGDEERSALERLADRMDHESKRLEHRTAVIGGHEAYAPQVVFDYLYRLSGMEESEAAQMTMRSVAMGERRWLDLGMDMTYMQTYGNWLSQFGIGDRERPENLYEAASLNGVGVYLLPARFLTAERLLNREAHVDLSQLSQRALDVERLSMEQRGHGVTAEELIRLMDQSYQMGVTGSARACRALLPPLWEETMRSLDKEAIERMTALGDKLFEKRTAYYEGFEGQEYVESFYVEDNMKEAFNERDYLNLSPEQWHAVASHTTEWVRFDLVPSETLSQKSFWMPIEDLVGKGRFLSMDEITGASYDEQMVFSHLPEFFRKDREIQKALLERGVVSPSFFGEEAVQYYKELEPWQYGSIPEAFRKMDAFRESAEAAFAFDSYMINEMPDRFLRPYMVEPAIKTDWTLLRRFSTEFLEEVPDIERVLLSGLDFLARGGRSFESLLASDDMSFSLAQDDLKKDALKYVPERLRSKRVIEAAVALDARNERFVPQSREKEQSARRQLSR